MSRERRLGLSWELWVIENLLGGAGVEDVVQTLRSQGIADDEAEQQVRAICDNPQFKGMRTRSGRAAMAEQLVRLRAGLRGPITLDAVSEITRTRFHKEYWRSMRPLVLRARLFKHVPAIRRWSIASFAERFGSVPTSVNVGRDRAQRRAEVEREVEETTLGEYIASIAQSVGNERYLVSRNGLLARPELAALANELTGLPHFVTRPKLPHGASLWIGPKGTYSAPHFDPHNVLLLQIEGRKRVRLVPPDQLAFVENMDGFFAGVDIDDPALAQRGFDPKSVLSVTLNPGEGLFVPVAWFHEVTALTPSMTLSIMSFPWDNDFHWLRPLSSSA